MKIIKIDKPIKRRRKSGSSRILVTIIRDSIKIGGVLVTGFTDKRTGKFSPDSASRRDFEQIQRTFKTNNTTRLRDIAKTKQLQKTNFENN